MGAKNEHKGKATKMVKMTQMTDQNKRRFFSSSPSKASLALSDSCADIVSVCCVFRLRSLILSWYMACTQQQETITATGGPRSSSSSPPSPSSSLAQRTRSWLAMNQRFCGAVRLDLGRWGRVFCSVQSVLQWAFWRRGRMPSCIQRGRSRNRL